MKIKRSALKQWIDKFFYNIKTYHDIEEEKRMEILASGILEGRIKLERYYVPALPWLGGGFKNRYIFKSDYSKSTWDKK